MRYTASLVALLLSVAGAFAEVTSVWNAARRAPGAVVPRSLITIRGAGLQVVTQAVISTPERDWVLSLLEVSDREILALVPEGITTGDAQLHLAAPSVPFAPSNIVVADHDLGFFTQSRAGSGPAAAQNNDALNTPSNPAVAAQLVTLWATGLGNNTEHLEVYIGSRGARIVYAGPAGCCRGMDQLIVEVPSDTETGCAVPVAAAYQGRISNFASIAVSQDGLLPECSDPLQLNPLDIPVGATVGSITTARNTSIERGELLISGGATVESFTRQRTEGISMRFWKLAHSQEQAAGQALGTCTAGSITPSTILPTLPSPSALDAGSRLIATGAGREVDLLPNAFGTYSLFQQLAEPVPGLPGVYRAGAPEFLIPGAQQLTGSGGSDVGAFSINVEVPDAFEWTNEQEVSRMPAEGPLIIQWTTPLGFPRAHVQIRAVTAEGFFFSCRHEATAGQIAIPEHVIRAFPSTSPVSFTIERATFPARLAGDIPIFAAHMDRITKLLRPERLKPGTQVVVDTTQGSRSGETN